MGNKLNEQIYRNMDLKETEELLEIWHRNDRNEWSDAAFQAIQVILEQRLGEVPLQDESLVEQDKVAKAVVVIAIIYNVLNFGNSQSIVASYFSGDVNSNWFLINVLALFLSVLNTAFGIAITYFPLKALVHILTALMQMEFNSRPRAIN